MVTTILVCTGPRGFPYCWPFGAKTGKVPIGPVGHPITVQHADLSSLMGRDSPVDTGFLISTFLGSFLR